MNRIIRDHYPAEKLPEDLQKLVDPSRPIRIVIEQDEVDQKLGPITRFAGTFGHYDVSSHEAVARIRALRDEWDD